MSITECPDSRVWTADRIAKSRANGRTFQDWLLLRLL